VSELPVRGHEASDESASERVGPDYRVDARWLWGVKQLGASATVVSGARGAEWTSGPFMFRLKVPVGAGRAPTRPTSPPELPDPHPPPLMWH